jgi:hypothetical protein
MNKSKRCNYSPVHSFYFPCEHLDAVSSENGMTQVVFPAASHFQTSSPLPRISWEGGIKGGWVSNYKTFIKHQIGKKKQGNMRSRSKVIRDRR